MSAFLGPIHHWLYRKILLQRQLVEAIVMLTDREIQDELQEKLAVRYGTWQQGSLEDMIDGSNIHGWLQTQVSQVEYQLAESVTDLLNTNKCSLKEISGVFYKNGYLSGTNIENKEKMIVAQFYKVMTDHLLDGMPCDHAMELISHDEKQVVWQKSQCVHEIYWKQVGGDIRSYYLLRDAWLKGFAKATGLIYKKLGDNQFTFYRGDADE